MAVAVFEKGQRVFVRPLGCWARVERVAPHWVKGVEQPMRVHYDLGLGRDFTAGELYAPDAGPRVRQDDPRWRVARVQAAGLVAQDGPPRTLPAVLTEEGDWGGWRIEASEYARDPERAENQAVLIAAAPAMFEAIRALTAWAEQQTEPLPPGLEEPLAQARRALRSAFGVGEPEPASG